MDAGQISEARGVMRFGKIDWKTARRCATTWLHLQSRGCEATLGIWLDSDWSMETGCNPDGVDAAPYNSQGSSSLATLGCEISSPLGNFPEELCPAPNAFHGCFAAIGLTPIQSKFRYGWFETLTIKFEERHEGDWIR
jgi:hypothetical protein